MKKNASLDCEKCVSFCNTPFKTLSSPSLYLLDQVKQVVNLTEGEQIDFSDKGRSQFFCVQAGHLRLDRMDIADKPQTMRICGPGEIIGYGADNKQFLLALEDSAICIIKSDDFASLQKHNPDFSISIIESLPCTASVKDDLMAGLQNNSVISRVASTLINLAKNFGTPSTFGILINLKIDRKTLAALSGTVTETLARALTSLEEDKLISRQGRKIHIIDMKKLTEISKS